MIPTAPDHPIAVLVSGGLDSCILASDLLTRGRVVQPLYIRSHLVWEKAELPALRRYLDRIRTPALRELVTLELPLIDLYGEHWSVSGRGTPGSGDPDEAVFLPGRNALLLIKAAVWCQLHAIPELALATLGTSPFADAKPPVLRAIAVAASVRRPTADCGSCCRFPGGINAA